MFFLLSNKNPAKCTGHMFLQIACEGAAAAVFAGSESDRVTEVTEVWGFKPLRLPLPCCCASPLVSSLPEACPDSLPCAEECSTNACDIFWLGLEVHFNTLHRGSSGSKIMCVKDYYRCTDYESVQSLPHFAYSAPINARNISVKTSSQMSQCFSILFILIYLHILV